MPLVVEQLQLWIIGFKWADLDPNRLWVRIPTPVRDNFSTLLEAILSDHLGCLTLASEKYQGNDPDEAKFYIRDWLDDVYAGIHGQYFNRKLLKHALIDREDFQDWCERRTIPLPEFWFPLGWTDYRWPEYDPRAATADIDSPDSVQTDVTISGTELASQVRPEPAPAKPSPEELRDSQIARIASQQIARVIWKEEPDKTIAAMCKDERILKYGGAQYFVEEVVRRWLKEVAPSPVRAKRGRPKKTNPTEGE